VELIVNQDRIWDPLIKAAEIIYEIKNTGQAVIDLHGESPALDETSLPVFFDYLESQGVDLACITVITGNPCETYSKVRVIHEPKSFYEIPLFQSNTHRIPTTKDIKYYFGNFVSRTTMPRLVLASHLYSNYRDKTFQTFHYAHDSHYHKTHLELDKLVHQYGANSAEFDEACILLKSAPLLKEEIESYPIIHVKENLKQLINPCQWYQNIFVDIICETWYQGTNFYITEKFWRAVATKTPFIIHGAQHIITNLHKLGFKTFHEFWDEGYQEDPSYYNIIGIKDTIKHIANQPPEEIHWMYYNMQEILDHNYEVFMNIKQEDIERAING
jgi:hypothetical protein